MFWKRRVSGQPPASGSGGVMCRMGSPAGRRRSTRVLPGERYARAFCSWHKTVLHTSIAVGHLFGMANS